MTVLLLAVWLLASVIFFLVLVRPSREDGVPDWFWNEEHDGAEWFVILLAAVVAGMLPPLILGAVLTELT